MTVPALLRSFDPPRRFALFPADLPHRRLTPMPSSRPESLPKPIRIVRDHARLFASIAVGIAVHSVLPEFGRWTTRVLVAWDVGVTFYLMFAFAMISRFDLKLVRQRAAIQDEGGFWLLVLTILSAVASFVAIIFEVGAVRGANDPHQELYFGLAVLTIALSWTFIHTIFALHYAHAYYGEGSGARGSGLNFPADARPDYWDFVYFSFVLGTTFQVSDVEITSKPLRRTALVHGVLSFVFNVAILAVVVNLAADVL